MNLYEMNNLYHNLLDRPGTSPERIKLLHKIKSIAGECRYNVKADRDGLVWERKKIKEE